MTIRCAGGRDVQRTWLPLALIVTLAAAVRLLSFRGYTTHDAAAYTELAHMMVSGTFKPGMLWFYPVFSARVGLFAPVALAFELGGVNEVMLALYPLLLSMSSVLLAYCAARAMFDTRAGLVAAGLMALLPIDARFATQLYPDMPAAFWMGAGIMLLYVGSRRGGLPGKFSAGALAGLTLFASWLCKETVLYLLPFVGLYLLWLVIKDRRNAAFLLAVALVAGFLVGLEGWVYHRETGDFFFRLSALRRNFASSTSVLPAFAPAGLVRYVASRLAEVSDETFLNPYFALIPLAALLACGYAALRKKRSFLFPALWFGWLLLLFSFGSASLKAYVPLNLHTARFQYPMLLPAVLLFSGFASLYLSPQRSGEPGGWFRTRRSARVVLCAYLVFLFLFTVALGIRTGMGRRCRVQREMARALKPTDPLYTDGLSAAALRFFWKYPAADSAHDFEGMLASQVPARVYVLLDQSELVLLSNVDNYEPPKFRDSVPDGWQVKRRKDHATLYWVPPLRLDGSTREH
jgi:4-amino-4-deoxy-L-arabinose transferase-like glycosyltransferase